MYFPLIWFFYIKKIFIKKNGKYNLKEPIYIYENGKVTLTTPNYIDEAKSNYKDTKNIYIALRRVSANHRYLIQVTDKGGNDPELIRNKLFFVKKGKASKKSTKSTKPKDAKAQNTNNTNTNGTAPDNTVDQNTVNDTNTNGATTGNTVDPNAVNDTNTNGTAPDNTVDQNTANSANQNETEPEVKVEKPKLTWNDKDGKRQIKVNIKNKSAKIKKVDLGKLKKYFKKDKSSDDYTWIYNCTQLAEDKKLTVTVTYENGKTAKSNKETVKMADHKPTIKFNKKTKKLTVTDPDGIKSAKVIKNSQYIKEPGKRNDDGTQMVFKMKRDTNGKKTLIIVRVKDKYERTEETDDLWIPKTRKSKKTSKTPVVDGKNVKYWNSNGKKTTKATTKTTTKTTTPTTPSKIEAPKLLWSQTSRSITITDKYGIQDVRFNKITMDKLHHAVGKKGDKKWVFILNEKEEVNKTEVMAHVSDSTGWQWTNKASVKIGSLKPTIKLADGGTNLKVTCNTQITKVEITYFGGKTKKTYTPKSTSWTRRIKSFKLNKNYYRNYYTSKSYKQSRDNF